MNTVNLSEMEVGEMGKISLIQKPDGEEGERLLNRFLSMGIVEGSDIEVAFEAPIARDPIAIKVRGGLIAIRRSDAKYIEVEI
jgi:Fe2+ transport system protein FeoA